MSYYRHQKPRRDGQNINTRDMVARRTVEVALFRFYSIAVGNASVKYYTDWLKS